MTMSALGCSQQATGVKLYVTGDSDAVGAQILIDGTRVGVMERRIYSGPPETEEGRKARVEGQRRLGLPFTSPPQPGDIFSVGAAVHRGEGDASRTDLGYDHVQVVPGPHEISFVHADGRRLAKRIDVASEAYLGVSFAEMRITGGD
jgi:hypothetical protein